MTPSLFLYFVRLRLRERTEHLRLFLLGMAAQIMGWGAEYAVIYLLVRRFDALGGWRWPELTLLFSLELLTYALAASFLFTPMHELEQSVADGSFDAVLTRPLDPLLGLAARRYNVGYLAHLLLSAGFLVWSARLVGGGWGAGHVGFLGLAIVGGACLQAAALILVGSLGFVAARASSGFVLLGQLRALNGFPLTVYPPAIQLLLTFVLPLAAVNFYPASALLGKEGAILPAGLLWLLSLVGPCALVGARRVFMFGIRGYRGAGG